MAIAEVINIEPKKKPDFKTIKITNPVFLGYLSEGIQLLTKTVEIPTITYETLFTYFVNTVQNGGEFAEFWVTMDEKDSLVYAYAHWLVRGLPHRGVVTCDFIHACRNRKDATMTLAKEFFNFGIKHRCPYYEGIAINEKTFRVFRKMASSMGFDFHIVKLINFLGRKR